METMAIIIDEDLEGVDEGVEVDGRVEASITDNQL